MLARLFWLMSISTVTILPAHAQTCQCKGQRLDQYKGGDKSPLSWTFEPYLAKRGSTDEPNIICYLKTIWNYSGLEVRRVYWQVAGFYRRYIAPNMPTSSCPAIRGDMNPDPRGGPLYYGVADHYDTTIREPKEGWKDTNVLGLSPLPDPAPLSFAMLTNDPLDSSFSVEITNENPPQTANITISSRIFVIYTPQANHIPAVETQLIYELNNVGNAPIWLRINLPNDDLLSKDVPLIANAVLLPPHNFLKYSSITTKKVAIQSAAIIFYDQGGQIVGMDRAGFYGLAEGRREIDAERLWQELKTDGAPNQP
jgi:hypothetical protein